MKKTVFLASAALLLSLAANTSQVFAAEGGTYPTQGTINFEAGDDVTPPVDPEDPDIPIDPVDPPTPVGGSLSIDYASQWKFGTQKISTTDQTYFAQLDQFKDSEGKPTIEKPNYVQVTDKRGTLEGWSLSVTQPEQFKTADGDELTGAVLKIKTAAIAGLSGSDTYTPGTVAASIDLTPGQEAAGITAEKTKGAGTWVYRFGNDADTGKKAIELDVPGKTVKLAKEYKTTLNWTLASTPGNNG